ncbi:MAG TPA: DUF4142 domain-containing protein [Polyangiaceae bacterium]
MTNKTRWLAVAVAGGALAAAGCQNDQNRSDAPPSSTVGQGASAGTARMDDNMKTNIVLRQLHAANQDEIENGKMAAERAASAEVKKFANEMVNDHTSADQKLTDLAKRLNFDLNMGPRDPLHSAFSSAKDAHKRNLRAQSGAQFEVAYLAPQVDDHELVLQLIDEGRKVGAADVKKLLDEIRPTVENHRDHAKNLMRGFTFSASAIGGGPATEATPEGTKGGKGEAGVIRQEGTRQQGAGQPGAGQPGTRTPRTDKTTPANP